MSSATKEKPRGTAHAHTERKQKGQECWYKNIDLPAEVALYYGFTLAESPVITTDDAKKARAVNDQELRNKDAPDTPTRLALEEKIAMLRVFEEKGFQNLPQPVMLYLDKAIVPENAPKKNPGKDRLIYLEAMGASKSITDALLIKTAMEILKEEGFLKLSLHINSIGDRDTMLRFGRELAAYYRKNIEILPSHCRQLLKKDVFDLLACKNEKCRIIKENAPKSMSFLSEQSRAHFKEILEHLETLEIPYEIDHFLVSHRSFACQTIFEIHTPESKSQCRPLGVGIRYGNIAKKIGFKKDIPGVGVKLNFKEKNSRKNLKFLKPKIYFVQLGFEAKLKSLKIIEILRQAKIPMHHGIARDKLASQLSVAENMRIPYTAIMGQKEVLENTVIIRNMANRSQESVKIEHLPKYLKKL